MEKIIKIKISFDSLLIKIDTENKDYMKDLKEELLNAIQESLYKIEEVNDDFEIMNFECKEVKE